MNPAEETLSHYLQFGFRDSRVETEKDPNISWSASVKDVEVWRLSIIFCEKKEKLHSCVTVYKNSAQADRLNSLVCLCSCRKKNQQILCFTFKLVPNLIGFFSNLKTDDVVASLLSISSPSLLKVALGWPAVAMVTPSITSLAVWMAALDVALLLSSASFIYIFWFSNPRLQSDRGLKAGRLLWKTGSHVPPADNVSFHCRGLTISVGFFSFLNQTVSEWSLFWPEGLKFIVRLQPRFSSFWNPKTIQQPPRQQTTQC